MTIPIHGPGSSYQLLFDDDDGDGPGLPAEFQHVYGGDWRLPRPAGRPYIYTNFVVSHDGRTSFEEPGHEGGGDISRHIPHDTWLMGLLRARADAIITGAVTLRVSRGHIWTAGHVFKADRAAFAALRAAEGRRPHPLLVIISRSGEISARARALAIPDQPAIIATTAAGAERARSMLGPRAHLSYSIAPGPELDMAALVHELWSGYGVQTLLSEGGGRIYGLLLAAGLLDDEFLTRSPVVVGNPPPPQHPRTGLVEGVGFSPIDPPQVRLLSLRRVGSYLFSRSRY